MAKVGYARVSSENQKLDRQIEKLEEYGCYKIFKEKKSGKNIEDRVELKRLLDSLDEDDELIVSSLDRISRNNNDIDKILSEVQAKKASFVALDLPKFGSIEDPNLRKMISNMVLEVFKFTSQNERERIKERQRQGIEIAKSKGVYKGSLPKYRADTPNQKDRLIYETVIKMLEDEKRVSDIVRKTGISKNTVKAIRDRETH